MTRNRYVPPRLPAISTPVQDDDDIDAKCGVPSTPSPQAVDEFERTGVTSANRSAVVSRMLSDHLVTVNDDEVIVSSSAVTLPELDPECGGQGGLAPCDDDEHSVNETTNDAAPLTPGASYSPLPPRRTPPMHVQHKMLTQSVSSIASPPARFEDRGAPRLHVGPERTVVFHAESLGIKISRCADGRVRVLSVTPYRAADAGADPPREGDIREGDVVREASDVCLRAPIDSAVWRLTVGLIRMAPRPLAFVVAEELPDFDEGDGGLEDRGDGGGEGAEDPICRSPSFIEESARTDGRRFGPTRTIHFFEPCLGVKLHHNADGYVQILSVTPYKSFPNSPVSRTGVMKEGDVVLEVGGMWDLREPIHDTSWGVLIRYIRETKRPLSMIVADAESLRKKTSEDEQDASGMAAYGSAVHGEGGKHFKSCDEEDHAAMKKLSLE